MTQFKSMYERFSFGLIITYESEGKYFGNIILIDYYSKFLRANRGYVEVGLNSIKSIMILEGSQEKKSSTFWTFCSSIWASG